jgi:hypothetical protein
MDGLKQPLSQKLTPEPSTQVLSEGDLAWLRSTSWKPPLVCDPASSSRETEETAEWVKTSLCGHDVNKTSQGAGALGTFSLLFSPWEIYPKGWLTWCLREGVLESGLG